jgi:hypothetical protein
MPMPPILGLLLATAAQTPEQAPVVVIAPEEERATARWSAPAPSSADRSSTPCHLAIRASFR